MSLPTSVAKVVQRGADAQRSAYPVAAPPPNPAPAAPAVASQDGAAGTGAPAPQAGAPAPQATAPTPATPEPPATTPTEHDPFEQRFNSLRGKYDKEVPALHQQVREANARAAALEATLASLSVAQAAAQPITPQPSAEPDGPDTELEQFRETYGDDFIKIAKKIAELTVRPHMATIEERFKQVGTAFQSNAELDEQRRREAVFALLDREIPNWAQINQDPMFVRWLNVMDQYSGQLRKELIQNAFNMGDGRRVALFFTTYLQEHAVTNPQSTTVETPPAPAGIPPAAGQGGPQVTLGSLVAPGRGPASAGGAPASGRTWSRADVAKLYRDRTAGLYRGKEQDFLAQERDMIAAQADGRFIP